MEVSGGQPHLLVRRVVRTCQQMALCKWTWAWAHTVSLRCIQSLTAGTFDGSLEHGKSEG